MGSIIHWGNIPVDRQEIAATLRERRKELDWTQEKLASILCTGREAVAKAEANGLTDLATIVYYFACLGIEVRLELREME